jgi:hypothetical protein
LTLGCLFSSFGGLDKGGKHINHPIYQDTCQSVDNVSIRIPQKPKPGNTAFETDFGRDQAFRNDWENALDDISSNDWSKLKYPEFDGLVREIHAVPWTSFEKACIFLEDYGEIKNLHLPGDWSGRQKPNFFKNEGQSGIKMLRNLLEQLEQLTADSKQHWEIGCKMLANRLSTIVPQQGEA